MVQWQTKLLPTVLEMRSGVKAAETRGIKRAGKMGKRAGWDSQRGSIRRISPYMAKELESMVLRENPSGRLPDSRLSTESF